MKPLLAIDFGFLPVGWLDVLDVVIVAFLVYQVYRLIRGTLAVQLALVLLALYGLNVLIQVFGLATLTALFSAVSEVFVLAIIILFAPEIRRLLFMLGNNPLVRRFVTTSPRARITGEVATAIAEMSENRIGSLIAFARSTGLRNYIESGTRIHADVERDLLTSIFFPNSPLHDGGVIIQGQKIEAARCIFPVSEARKLDPHLGLRHRAAIGLSERTDAFVIVTSEETGAISIAENGQLDYNLSIGEVEARLNAAFAPDRPAPSEAELPSPSDSLS
ncbi:MAG: TIGR00159 family protein [Rhodothermaceae bacterium]|nr:TIGR00159 family protein [Rhodothermaceae bacterium]